ncbi:MAG: hypothetical protein HDS27_06150 [Bacteroides sp.]|nr:hypothetical protein [Bacteroides sp.]
MKKLMIMLAVIIGALSANARDNYSHNAADLPMSAQTILKNNFKAKVNHFKIEKDFGKIKEYDVILTDGTEVTFDSHGNWKDIEVKMKSAVPSALIPQEILSYVKLNQKKHQNHRYREKTRRLRSGTIQRSGDEIQLRRKIPALR